MLTAGILHRYGDAGRFVREADGRLGLVDMLRGISSANTNSEGGSLTCPPAPRERMTSVLTSLGSTRSVLESSGITGKVCSSQ